MTQVQKIIKDGKRQDLNLKRTRSCVQMWREAKLQGFPYQMIVEIELLIGQMAIEEWGKGTTYDDFLEEGKITVSNGKKQIIL